MGRIEVPIGAKGGPKDDDAILAEAASHDRQAFMPLYDRYVGAVERYIAARTASSDVDDLVSITFTRAIGNIHRYQPERASFAAWLFTIARNAVIDHYRERARSVPLEASDPERSRDPGPEAQALTNEDANRMSIALQELTPDQRDALALRYAADLPFASIGQALGKSEPAAKMLVQRGLQALRRQFDKDQTHD